jgi:bifunctional non-homologous end joining protein LigD
MNSALTRIFDAARKGDVETTRACLEAGADPAACNEYGFTALHCAAMGSNSADIDRIVDVMKLLLEAGSPIEAIGGGGRTALYLAAEFSQSVAPVQLLLEAGANANVTDQHGNTIVENAMIPEVQSLLSTVTGIPVPEPPPPTPAPVKLTAKEWRDVKKRIDVVFELLSANGLIALQDVGYTQEDGFSDCSEAFQDRGGQDAGVHGFCYYTRQELNRAKRTSQLPLAFWGAPEGADNDMKRVGELIVDAFRSAGFSIEWNGSSSVRPTLYLKET